MSAIDTLRTALFGDPPQPGFKPSREGFLAAFSELYARTLGLTTGLQSYALRASLPASTETAPLGTQARVYADPTPANNTFWIRTAASGTNNGWEVDQDYIDLAASVVQPMLDAAEAAEDGANLALEEARNVILAPASYGVPLGEAITNGGSVQGAAGTYRFQTPAKYDFQGTTLEINNGGAAGLQVILRAFDANGNELPTPSNSYSGQKVITLAAGVNTGIDISDFYHPAGSYRGIYAQIDALTADTTKKSTMGGYWFRTGNQTTGITTVSNAGVRHDFRINGIEKVMRGAEYAESLRAAPTATSTSYGAEIEHVWNGSSLNAGNHGETPPALLLADFYGTDRDNVRNVAVGGRTVAQMLAAATAELYPVLDAAFATGRIVVLHVDSGVIYNTVNGNSASSAANAAANIATAFNAMLAGFTTWKTAYPSLVIDLADLPNVFGAQYWVPEHYTAFQATFQSTAMNSGVVDYTTRISTVPESQVNTDAAFWNPDRVHPMTALNVLSTPLLVASLNSYIWKRLLGNG